MNRMMSRNNKSAPSTHGPNATPKRNASTVAVDDATPEIRRITVGFGGTILTIARARAVSRATRILQGLLLAALVLLCIMLAYRVAMAGAPAGTPGYSALYVAIALVAAFAVQRRADRKAVAAGAAFTRSESKLAALISDATTAAHTRLADLRRRMQQPVSLADAFQAAYMARELTTGAQTLLAGLPGIGIAIDEDSQVDDRRLSLAMSLRNAAAAAAQRNAILRGRAISTMAGAAAGLALFAMSVQGPIAFAPAPQLIHALAELEKAHAGVFTLPAALALLIAMAQVAPTMLAEKCALSRPQAILAQTDIDPLVSRLRLRVVESAAERPAELVERYADAEQALFQNLRRLGAAEA